MVSSDGWKSRYRRVHIVPAGVHDACIPGCVWQTGLFGDRQSVNVRADGNGFFGALAVNGRADAMPGDVLFVRDAELVQPGTDFRLGTILVFAQLRMHVNVPTKRSGFGKDIVDLCT